MVGVNRSKFLSVEGGKENGRGKEEEEKKKKKTRNECRLSIDDMSVCASRDSTAGLVS